MNQTQDGQPELDLTADPGDDPRLVAALEEYRAQLESGKKVDRQEFLARYAEIQAELDECLIALELVHVASGELNPLRKITAEQEPPSPLGDFRIIREIGRGGMGVVYEAVQLSLGRPVALKVLPFAAALDARRLQRFKHEAQTAAHLHHTNIVPVHGVGCERGVHYYAMQFIEGRTLDAIIQELSRPIEVTEAREGVANDTAPTPTLAVLSTERTVDKRAFFRSAARLMVQAAQALDYAHQEGVVHRDIKPANLLVDVKGTLWITDFGLARLQDEAGLTMTGDLIGTLRYMSPEQALGRRGVVDQRCDIYSLGITFYEFLTLRPAFTGQDRQELLHQIAEEEPTLPRQVDRSIPVELETVVLKAIAKSPTERYATAQELADDLQRFLDDRPILARRPSVIEKLVKWSRRHRAVVAWATLMLLLSTVGLSISTLLIAQEQRATKAAYLRERQKAEEASEQRARAQASFQQARRAVDFFTQISEDELAEQPLLYGVRRKLLEAALVYYQDFIDQPQDDASIQAELSASQARVTQLLEELSALEDSVPLQLLTDRWVQEDLKPSESQKQKLKELGNRLAEQRREAFRDIRTLSPEERRQRFLEMARGNETDVANILTPEQLKRLKQIGWQQRGPHAFADPEVVFVLSLSNEQQKKIRAIRGDLDLAMLDTVDASMNWGPPMGPRKKRDDFARAALEQALEVLTAEQKTHWKELVGAPFKAMQQRMGPPDRYFDPRRPGR